MDMQNHDPRGRSSSISPGPGAAVECKTPGVARGDVGALNWLMHYFYFTLGSSVQENSDVIPEMEDREPKSIYHSLDNIKKCILEHYFKLLIYGRRKDNKNRCSQKSITFQNTVILQNVCAFGEKLIDYYLSKAFVIHHIHRAWPKWPPSVIVFSYITWVLTSERTYYLSSQSQSGSGKAHVSSEITVK